MSKFLVNWIRALYNLNQGVERIIFFRTGIKNKMLLKYAWKKSDGQATVKKLKLKTN